MGIADVPVTPLAAVAVTLSAFVASWLLSSADNASRVPAGRFASIDGLRGYLALFVFLHHACIWYFLLRTGRWDPPPSHLFTHLGRSSVALFFMITGFLFFNKLLEARSNPMDWGRLFVSRFMRLVPLYLFTVLLLLVVVAVLSAGRMAEPAPQLMKNIAHWLAFTVFDDPDLNGVLQTKLIVAGVTWSLPYEWFFYLLLPLLALVVGVIAPTRYLAVGLAALVAMVAWHPKARYLFPFVGGICATFLARSDLFRRLSTARLSSWVPLVCAALAVALYPSSYEIGSLLLLSVAFCFIACGNTLFGVLLKPASRMLGEMAYSIYLLHGILLFCTFHFVIGLDRSRSLSAMAHWALVVGITPLLVAICFASFRSIERPAIRSSGAVWHWLEARLGRRVAANH